MSLNLRRQTEHASPLEVAAPMHRTLHVSALLTLERRHQQSERTTHLRVRHRLPVISHSLHLANNVSNRVRVHHGRAITHQALILLVHEILRLVLARLFILLVRRLIKPDSDSHSRVRIVKKTTLVARVANVRARRETTTVKHTHAILSFTIHQRTAARRARPARELRQPLTASRPILIHANRRFQAWPRVHEQFALLPQAIPEAALCAAPIRAGRRSTGNASRSHVTDITAHAKRARTHAAHRPRQPRQRRTLSGTTRRQGGQ